MNTKNLAIICVTVVVSLSLVIASGLLLANRFSQDLTSSTFIAEERVVQKVPQDKARLNIYVEESNLNQASANQEMERVLSSLVSYLESQGFSQSDMVTNSSLYNQPDWYYPMLTEDKPDQEFAARGEIQLTISNLQERQDTFAPVFQELLDQGATSLSQLQYEVENQEEICQQLELEALKQARTKADEILTAISGTKITKVQVLSTQSSCNMGGIFPMYRSDRSVSSEPTLGAPEAQPTTPRISGEAELWASTQLEISYR